jgi:ABC-type glycerol-3-phosphate transport system substrate-binding protein
MKIYCRSLVLVALLVAVVFMSGCETLKGAASGFKQDVVNVWHWTQDLERVAW